MHVFSFFFWFPLWLEAFSVYRLFPFYSCITTDFCCKETNQFIWLNKSFDNNSRKKSPKRKLFLFSKHSNVVFSLTQSHKFSFKADRAECGWGKVKRKMSNFHKWLWFVNVIGIIHDLFISVWTRAHLNENIILTKLNKLFQFSFKYPNDDAAKPIE